VGELPTVREAKGGDREKAGSPIAYSSKPFEKKGVVLRIVCG
jgi:hypothetical protein